MGGVIITRYMTREQDNVDITFQEQQQIPPPDPLTTGRAGEILQYGCPVEGVPGPLVYRNHVLGYDSVRRVPRWVAEHLSRETVNQTQVANRKGVNFGPDPVVPRMFSSDNKDYWGSGWSRGHMAPAGNNKHCQDSMNQTFLLTNVVPQDMDNNGNYWNRLEIYCRNLAKKYNDVWITSGPLWLPKEVVTEDDVTVKETVKETVEETGDKKQTTEKKNKVRPPRPKIKKMSYKVIGSNEVSVPTHLYKVVLVSDPSLSTPLMAAFVVPNSPVGDRHLTEFQVDLHLLERYTGLNFHPKLERAVTGNLCEEDGCNLQNYKEFQQFFWNRRLSSPWNLRGLERDWEEAKRKGVVTPALEHVYITSKDRLLVKEREERIQHQNKDCTPPAA